MTFATLHALQAIVGDEIYAVYLHFRKSPFRFSLPSSLALAVSIIHSPSFSKATSSLSWLKSHIFFCLT
jgi:hypothetical protein